MTEQGPNNEAVHVSRERDLYLRFDSAIGRLQAMHDAMTSYFGGKKARAEELLREMNSAYSAVEDEQPLPAGSRSAEDMIRDVNELVA